MYYSNTESNGYTDRNRNWHGHGYSDRDLYRNTDTESNDHSHGHWDSCRDTESNTEWWIFRLTNIEPHIDANRDSYSE